MTINFSLPCYVWIFTITLASVGAETVPSAIKPEPVLAIDVDKAILLYQPESTDNTAHFHVATHHFPQDARLLYEWKQVQDLMSPVAADATKKVVHLDHPDTADVTATFPDWGVYEIRLTVTDPAHHLQASRNTWINVWDSRSHIIHDGKPDPLCAAPGLTPPKVRNLSPDPGPFQHPRLLCTNDDWSEIHQRTVMGEGRIASVGFKKLKQLCDHAFDLNIANGLCAEHLIQYAANGWQGSEPDLMAGEKDLKAVKFLDSLYLSAFYNWMKVDPRLPHAQVDPASADQFRKLSTLLGTYCHVYLKNCWQPDKSGRSLGTFNKTYPLFPQNLDHPGVNIQPREIGFDVALAYDFLQSWMTDQEQRETRNLLFALGAGRQTSHGYGVKENRWIGRGVEQQGTFSNFGEYQIAPSLVVSGEEKGADPRVIQAFLDATPDKPEPDKTSICAYEGLRLCTADSGWGSVMSKPYPEAMCWPHARKADVDNLQREIWEGADGVVSPWGFTAEREAYHTFYTATVWPHAVMMARFGGQNLFVCGNYYNNVNMILYSMYPYFKPQTSASFSSNMAKIDHHAGNGDHRLTHTLLLKYMYPDDPAVDYVYATRAPGLESGVHMNLLEACLFALDPSIKDTANLMESVSQSKGLPLTRVDPEIGFVVMRSSWKDDAVLVDFDDGFENGGHMNAEKNSFALFALGRSWAVPPGFHKIYSNWYSGIHVQEPQWASCPVTQGYVGINPCFKPQVESCDMPHNFPTPPGHLLEVKEGGNHDYAMVAGDATAAYNYVCVSPDYKRVSLRRADFMYPGLLDDITTRCPFFAKMLTDSINPYYKFVDTPFFPYPPTSVDHAIRTLFMARGQRPYLLVVDDFEKDGHPRNYRWMMCNRHRTQPDWGGQPNSGELSMIMAPGATSTEAILLHRQDDRQEPNLPRLLVRDVSEVDNSQQPAIRLDTTQFPTRAKEDFYLKEQESRIFIERQNKIEPQYKILLFPFRTGEKLPLTRWNTDKTQLTVDLQDGTVDTFTFNRLNPDHRTRVHYQRTLVSFPNK